MTSLFDRQFNCLTEPEKGLTWSFLLITLDPLVPGMLASVYDAAWATAGGTDGKREAVYRQAFGLIDVYIDPVDFVVTTAGPWFADFAASIAAGASTPFADCVSNSF